MPACFSLFRKGTNERVILQEVDDKLRAHFGCDPDPDNYASWYGCIGFLVAMGKGNLGTQELRTAIHKWYFPDNGFGPGPEAQEYYDAMIQQLNYLEEHYSSDGWTTIGKR